MGNSVTSCPNVTVSSIQTVAGSVKVTPRRSARARIRSRRAFSAQARSARSSICRSSRSPPAWRVVSSGAPSASASAASETSQSASSAWRASRCSQSHARAKHATPRLTASTDEPAASASCSCRMRAPRPAESRSMPPHAAPGRWAASSASGADVSCWHRIRRESVSAERSGIAPETTNTERADSGIAATAACSGLTSDWGTQTTAEPKQSRNCPVSGVQAATSGAQPALRAVRAA